MLPVKDIIFYFKYKNKCIDNILNYSFYIQILYLQNVG